MNRIELENEGFPFTADSVRFMQTAYSDAIKNICKTIGPDFIAWGCEVIGDNITEGAIVINGELIPFESGSYNSKVIVEEKSEMVTYYDQISRPAYFTKVARCSELGSYNLADFPRPKRQIPLSETDWLDVPLVVTSQGTLIPEAQTEPYVFFADKFKFSGERKLQAKRTATGQVMLKGGLIIPVVNRSPYHYATLPEEVRPQRDVVIPVTAVSYRTFDDTVRDEYANYSAAYTFGYATITKDGLIILEEIFGESFEGIERYPIFNCVFNID